MVVASQRDFVPFRIVDSLDVLLQQEGLQDAHYGDGERIFEVTRFLLEQIKVFREKAQRLIQVLLCVDLILLYVSKEKLKKKGGGEVI